MCKRNDTWDQAPIALSSLHLTICSHHISLFLIHLFATTIINTPTSSLLYSISSFNLFLKKKILLNPPLSQSLLRTETYTHSLYIYIYVHYIFTILHMMMSFCRKSVHSFLNLTNCNTNNYHSPSSPSSSTSSSSQSSTSSSMTNTKHGLGLITIDEDSDKRDKGDESCPQSPARSPRVANNGNGGGGGGVKGKIGFVDDVADGGLMSCTESLGFESSNERIVDDTIESGMRDDSWEAHWEKVKEKKNREKIKQYPPPLPWLNNGQPSFFLRPVRTNGRLELMEVRVDKPEILRASREDGRLRLHLVREDDDEEEEENEEDEKEDEEIGEDLVEEEEKKNEEVDEWRIGEWKFPVTGEGLIRRCNEPHHHHHHHRRNMNHHHHSSLHVWGQQYVATR